MYVLMQAAPELYRHVFILHTEQLQLNVSNRKFPDKLNVDLPSETGCYGLNCIPLQVSMLKP